MGLIFLTGMPGAGKSATAAALARILDSPGIDLDEMIERRAGRSIAKIFADSGEAAFRQLESEALADVAEMHDAVVALGAGALERAENRAAVAHGALIYLRADLDLLLTRAQLLRDSRPLLSGARNAVELRSRLAALLARREAHYLSAIVTVDAGSGQTPDELAAQIVEMLARYADR